MSPELLTRYVVRLRAEGAGHHSVSVDVPYMVGRKRREQGFPWSNAGRLTYRAQRLARLGYSDAAHGLPVRPEVEDWPSIDI